MKKIFAFIAVLLVPAFAYAGGGDEVVEESGWESKGPLDLCPAAGEVSGGTEDAQEALDGCNKARQDASQATSEDTDADTGDNVMSRKAVIHVIDVRIEKLEGKLLELIKKNERDIINLKNRVKALEDENGGSCTETCKKLRKELSQKFETLYQLVKTNRGLINELSEQQASDHKLLVMIEKEVINMKGEVAGNTERANQALEDAGIARGAAEEALEIAKELEGSMALASRSDLKILGGIKGNLRKPVFDGDDDIRDGNALSVTGGVMLRRPCKPSAGCYSTNVGGRANLQLDDFQRGATIGGEVFVEHMFGDADLAIGPHLGVSVTGHNLQSSGHTELYSLGVAPGIVVSHELNDDIALRGELGVKIQGSGSKRDDGTRVNVRSTNPFIGLGFAF